MFKRVAKKVLSEVFYLTSGRNFIASAGRPKINGFCKFGAKLILGVNANFNGARTYGAGKIYIGDNFHSGVGLKILTQSHNYSGESIPYDKTIIVKDVIIGDNVWIGMSVMVLPGVRIGEGAIIQAGSVVSKSIPDLAIAGGNPAEVIRFRDKNHYFKMKQDERYL
ncbi:acetyltransferase [Pseudomonas ogarae]|uniref:acyltransferase n=1 Tax=Pseudomonas ogarae (strain DSM 112162 / CECT 30235 / F113) TaxID=1114970 RepID=UPI0009A2F83B|nr:MULTISPECIES: acyltransferase [Pseudomonas]OPG69310.1 acetyltransferase [Pseudomonas ogarae]OPG79219.1 acetyltransferase [Pseudomonas ogarae]QXH96597.1 acyltransferase [Pseudomonas zarinae]